MTTSSKSEHSFHYLWRDKNEVKLLVDSPRIFPSMLAAIYTATNFILFEMYLIQSGQIVDKFIAAFLLAAQRGVKIYLLFDDFGAGSFSNKDHKRLENENIELEYYNPIKLGELRRGLFRNHRKLLVVDNKTVFVGGIGITDAFDYESNQKLYWRETVLQIQGLCIEDWIDLFKSTWFLATKRGLQLKYPTMERVTNEYINDEQLDKDPVAKNVLGRLTLAKGPGKQEIKRSFINRVRRAKKCVWVATAYFMPSLKVRRELARAARRGVEVSLILPGRHIDHPAVRHAGRRFYLTLLNAGVNIYEYQPRFMHQKVLLCDNWVSIGSSNLDRWNFRWNLEANQEIEDAEFVKKVNGMLQKDRAESQHIQLSDWKRRPFRLRVLTWFWGGGWISGWIVIFVNSYLKRKNSFRIDCLLSLLG